MSIDNLKSGLPEYAKDLKLNLGTLARSTELSEQQLWGTFVATAAATRNDAVFSEIADEAKEHLSDEAFNAALGAATIMAMNNVAYRAKEFLGSDYTPVKMGLRMNIIANPGVEKADFELCENCTAAHDKTVRGEGLTKEQVFEAVKIAATMQGVAQAVQIEEAR